MTERRKRKNRPGAMTSSKRKNQAMRRTRHKNAAKNAVVKGGKA